MPNARVLSLSQQKHSKTNYLNCKLNVTLQSNSIAIWKRTTNWSRNFLNQFCLKKNHELISEFLESVLFEKEPRIDLGISWISFVWKRTTNWTRNFLNQFCLKKNHELISEFLESVLCEKEPRIDLGNSWISFVWKRTTKWSRNLLN